ncbi:MAG: endonuclease/exonuclease/phosphatase family protein [Bacteroidetes bacterium]|jgi:endonuclease/exonuclease/phosphatase family metal-dependent hydrolase|nr:endonuclease/exonuclease/phosphatase family protein [Bacteroidota bacterium]
MKQIYHKNITWLIPTLILLICISCGKYTAENSSTGNDHYSQATATPEWYNPESVDTLTVVTWNIEHFVDDFDNPYIDNERENKPTADMEERRTLLAKALQALDADIVVFQELESDSYLRILAENYFPELGYEIFAALESPDWYMNVVMMSRVPLGVFYSYAHANTPIPGQTDEEGRPESQTFINNRMWTAEILVNPDYRFTLTGLHLKAGRGERNEAWRIGQIDLLREHLESLVISNEQKNMLVVGDLNTPPGSREFNRLLGDQPPHFFDPLERSGAFSHPSDSLFWRIDHILPNRQMGPELAPGTVQVAEPLNREQMIRISDHLPIVARFVTTDK